MIKYFKERREFKKSIKGIFDDWEVLEEGTRMQYKLYKIYINDRGDLIDWFSTRSFISKFNKWEASLLAKEALRRMKPQKDKYNLESKKNEEKKEKEKRELNIIKRNEINKEFNIK